MLTELTVLFLLFAPQDHVLHRAGVVYPRAAKEKGIQGSVAIEVSVDEEGLVSDARVLSGPQELRNAALRSVLDWHFSKSMQLPAVTQVTVDFTLPPAALPRVPDTPERYPARIEDQRVEAVEIKDLSGAAQQQLLARLPVQPGQTIDSERFERLKAEVKSFDEHLGVMLLRKPGGQVTIDIGRRAAPPVPPATIGVAPQQIRVSGNVQQAKLVRQPRPVYPVEAKQARIQGVVQLHAVIGRDGAVKDLELVNGAPELAPAAMEAVRQWVYEPTLLNGAPVEVSTQIDVNFTLAR